MRGTRTEPRAGLAVVNQNFATVDARFAVLGTGHEKIIELLGGQPG